MFEETGDEAKSQGWTPFILDTNGNGKRDDYVEPNQPLDPAKDKRVAVNIYAVAVSPVDGSVWGTRSGLSRPRRPRRAGAEPDARPRSPRSTSRRSPATGRAAATSTATASSGRRWRAGTWRASIAASARCSTGRPRPASTAPRAGRCTRSPDRSSRTCSDPGSAESSYYTWVDQYDTFGLGKNVPIATGNLNDSLLALVDGKFVNLRVPYPIGFFTKWTEGRIDDPNAGWKGRALWTTYSTRTMFHLEGGKENRPKVVRFQLRPDPLAR